MPTDHEIFNSINTAQWMWYYNQYIEDQESNFISSRNLVEYNASFTNPEAVSKIREAREKAVKVTNKDFSTGLERFFGRAIGDPDEKKGDDSLVKVNPSDAIEAYNRISKSNEKINVDTTLNYKYWLDSDME